MKCSSIWLNTRRQISELKDIARETVQIKTHTAKRLKKINRASVFHRAIASMAIKIQEVEGKRKEKKTVGGNVKC